MCPSQRPRLPACPLPISDRRGGSQNRTFASFLPPDLGNRVLPENINCYSEGGGPSPSQWPPGETVPRLLRMRRWGQRGEGTVCSSLLEQSQTSSPAQASQAHAPSSVWALSWVLGPRGEEGTRQGAKGGSCPLAVAGGHSWSASPPGLTSGRRPLLTAGRGQVA